MAKHRKGKGRWGAVAVAAISAGTGLLVGMGVGSGADGPNGILTELAEMATKCRDLALIIGGTVGIWIAVWRLRLADEKEKREQEQHEAGRKEREGAEIARHEKLFADRIQAAVEESTEEKANGVLREFALRDILWMAMITEEPLGRRFREEAVGVMEGIEENERTRQQGGAEAESRICEMAKYFRKQLIQYDAGTACPAIERGTARPPIPKG